MISHDIEITHLDSLPSLTTLCFTNLTKLVSVDLPRLVTLRINCELFFIDGFGLFPLEQLTDLSCRIDFDPAPLFPRWKSLVTLEICKTSKGKCTHLPKLPIRSLQSLTVYYFDCIDVSGLSQLRKLVIRGVEEVRGLSDVYVSLKYFSISTFFQYFSIPLINPILDDLLTHSTNDSLKVRFTGTTYDEKVQPPYLIHERNLALFFYFSCERK
jgi:hypothetical protein